MKHILFFILIFSLAGQSHAKSSRRRCYKIFEYTEEAAGPYLHSPFLYQIRKGLPIASLFVTPPVPLPLNALSRTHRRIFFSYDKWFFLRAYQKQESLGPEWREVHAPGVKLSEALSETAKMRLTEVLLQSRKSEAHRLIWPFTSNGRLERRWRESAQMGLQEKKALMSRVMDGYTPMEAFQIASDYFVRGAARGKFIEEQLFARARRPRVEDMLSPHERRSLLVEEIKNFSVSDLDQYLSARNSIPDLFDAYMEGNEQQAHYERDLFAANVSERIRAQRNVLIQHMLVPQIEQNLASPGKKLFFIPATEAFGEEGLLVQLQHSGFEVLRLR